MRRRNWRVVSVGFVLIVLAVGFYLFMLPMAGSTLDPVEFLRTVGQVSGVVIGVSIAMILVGLIGKKV